MNIALFASPAVFAPLHGFYRWLTGGLTDGLMDGSARAVRPMQRNSLRQSAFPAQPGARLGARPGAKTGARPDALGGCAADGNLARDGHAFAKEFVDGQLSGPLSRPLSGLSGGPVGSARPLRKITPRASVPVPVPVRMIRLREAGQARASVGRMVISGRMADVCAELDRLAACEAALH